MPPYNCDLNPIEEVWKDIKDEVRKLNIDQTLRTVTETAKKVMLNYDVTKWKNHVQHIIRYVFISIEVLNMNIRQYFHTYCRLEDEYWQEDGFNESFFDARRKYFPNCEYTNFNV